MILETKVKAGDGECRLMNGRWAVKRCWGSVVVMSFCPTLFGRRGLPFSPRAKGQGPYLHPCLPQLGQKIGQVSADQIQSL